MQIQKINGMSIDNIYTLEQNELTEEDQLNKQYSLYPNIYKDKNETLNATTTTTTTKIECKHQI